MLKRIPRLLLILIVFSSTAFADRPVTDQPNRTVTLADHITRAVVLQHQTLKLCRGISPCPQVKVRSLPAVLDFKVTYGLCLLEEGSVAAQELIAFILCAQGPQILQRMGMLSLI